MPPSFKHGKQSAAYVREFNFGQVVSDGGASYNTDTADVTVYGDGDRKFISGIRAASMTMNGFHDGSTASLTESVAVLQGGSTFLPITYAFGNSAIGAACRLGLGIPTQADINAPVSGAVGANFAFTLDGGSRHGRLLRSHNEAARSSTGNGTSVDFGHTIDGSTYDDPMPSGGYAGHLHVFSKTGTITTCTIKIQHSSAGSVWADLITFSNVTAAGAQRVTATASVKRFLREQVSTITGTAPTVTYAVSFGKPVTLAG